MPPSRLPPQPLTHHGSTPAHRMHMPRLPLHDTCWDPLMLGSADALFYPPIATFGRNLPVLPGGTFLIAGHPPVRRSSARV